MIGISVFGQKSNCPPGVRARRAVNLPLGLATGCAWLALGLGSHGIAIPAICTAQIVWSVPSTDLISFVVSFNSPWQLMLGWLAMIAAMMVPMLGEQLVQVVQRSSKSTRTALLASLLGGFILVWSLAGVLLIGLSIALRLAFASHIVPALLVLAAAGIWQASPFKQHALNMCHRDPTFAPFGSKALWDCLRLGLRAGFWCFVSCWGIMLLALMIPGFHLTAMVFASLVVWAERCERPNPPQWRLRLPRTFVKALTARVSLTAAKLNQAKLA